MMTIPERPQGGHWKFYDKNKKNKVPWEKMTQIYQDIINTHKNEVNFIEMGSVVIGSSEGDLPLVLMPKSARLNKD